MANINEQVSKLKAELAQLHKGLLAENVALKTIVEELAIKAGVNPAKFRERFNERRAFVTENADDLLAGKPVNFEHRSIFE